MQPEVMKKKNFLAGGMMWNDAWKYAVITFVVMRIFFSVWMWGVRQAFPINLPPDPVLRPYLEIEPVDNSWLEVWQRWDTLHYQAIAERGYSAYDTAVFTPPLYPWLIDAFDEILGGSLIAGILISNVFFLLTLVYWYRLVQMEVNSAVAKRALLYLASFPTSFFFIAAYTESIYTFAAVMMFYSLRREKFHLAGVWAAVASFTRLPGLLIVTPFLYLLYVYWKHKDEKRDRVLIGLFIGAAGAVTYPVYAYFVLGLSPVALFQIASSRFAGETVFPGYALIPAFQQVFSGVFVTTNLIDVFSALAFTIGIYYVWKNLDPVYTVYCVFIMLMLLTRLSGLQPMLSMARYVLAIFPVIMVFSIFGKNPRFNRIYLYTSWVLSLYLSAQFALWGWVA